MATITYSISGSRHFLMLIWEVGIKPQGKIKFFISNDTDASKAF